MKQSRQKVKKNLVYKNQRRNPSIKSITQMRTQVDTTQRGGKNGSKESMKNKGKKSLCK
jgi:hypothetical protein